MAKKKATELHNSITDAHKLDSLQLQGCRSVEAEFAREFKILEKHLQNPDFGVGPTTIGSELEIALVNKSNMLPSMLNLAICDTFTTKNIQPEISKFCLELNGAVIDIKDCPFAQLYNNLADELHVINDAANKQFNTQLVPIGILPTITTDDLGMDALTPYWRYYSIDKLLRLLRRNTECVLDIDGEDPLHLKWFNTVIEGVNSSYQVHLRVNPSEYNEHYNAAQLAAAFVLSVSGNSPLLFGHSLWDETRIAVFEQAVNNYNVHPGHWQEQQRVSFGRGWIKNGVLGLLKETCDLFYPIFPSIQKSKKLSIANMFSSHKGPDLKHIAQHNSSVWSWNRAIYDAAGGGHFRVEMRYLPSGPTIEDMVANTAFMLGLTKAFTKNIDNIISELPFKYAQYNFYQAAQYGLDAKCIWRDKKSHILNEVDMISLLDEMLDLSGVGLSDFGVSDEEITKMQNCIKSRISNRLTGAVWQRDVYKHFRNRFKLSKVAAAQEMLRLYVDNQQNSGHVGEWSKELS